MSNYDINTVKTMVDKDYDISQKLLAILQNETTSIRDRDFEGIKAILLSKASLLDQLKNHADIRKQWLISLHQVADEQHWQTLIKSFDAPEVLGKWSKVNETINECKKINNVNGVLISRSQKTHGQLLHLLKGNTPSNELYTARGNKQATRAYCTVAKA